MSVVLRTWPRAHVIRAANHDALKSLLPRQRLGSPVSHLVADWSVAKVLGIQEFFDGRDSLVFVPQRKRKSST